MRRFGLADFAFMLLGAGIVECFYDWRAAFGCMIAAVGCGVLSVTDA